ncbi:MAG: hypothetical protein Aurels2KO_31440 [Aureliella sp.]
MISRAEFLVSLGYSTILIDFQAHGESGGDAITMGHLESRDVEAAVALAEQLHPGEPIGVLGVSLGGAAALLACPIEIDALILESVYSTIDKAVHNRVADRLGKLAYVPSQLLILQLKPRLGISTSQLRPIERMPFVSCPVFIMSGEDDRHTTEAETRDMYAAATSLKELWVVPGAAHVDLLAIAPDGYRDRVESFLKSSMNNQ